MDISIKDISLEAVDGVIISVFEDDNNSSAEVISLLNLSTFKGKEGEIFYTTQLSENIKYKIFVGLGKRELLNGEVLRNAVATVTPVAVGDFWSVSFETFIELPCGCCDTITVRNISETTAIDVINANIVIDRVA
jgi:leucyl aminopeptidase